MAEEWEWESPQEEESRKARAEERELRLMGEIQKLAQTRDGRYFLRWIGETTGVSQINACVESYPLSAFREGLRAFGLKVLGLAVKAGCVNALFENEYEEGQ